MTYKICVVLCLCCAISLVPGATIISATFPPRESSAIYALQAAWVSFHQSISYGNVTIATDLPSGSHCATRTTYLTNAIGAGANASNLLATTSYSLQPGLQNTTVFSGLTLGAGIYYVTLWGSCCFSCSGGDWLSAEDPSHVIVGAGVSNNRGFVKHSINTSFPSATDYAAANFRNFPHQSAYLATGTAITSVRELGTLGVAILGIVYFGLVRCIQLSRRVGRHRAEACRALYSRFPR